MGDNPRNSKFLAVVDSFWIADNPPDSARYPSFASFWTRTNSCQITELMGQN